jgi:HAE1 family hydrophobic/amphiphilic exporter-1
MQVDPAKLAALGLSLEDVRTVLADGHRQRAQGHDRRANQSFTVYTNDQLLKAAPWNDVVLAYRNGAPIRVRDIGVAVDGPRSQDRRRLRLAAPAAPAERPRHRAGHHQAARRQRHRDRRPDQGRAAAPEGRDPAVVKINVLSDRTQTIRASVQDVQFTLLLTIALVVMVIFVFLRSVWATVIPSVTVPLALLGAWRDVCWATASTTCR